LHIRADEFDVNRVAHFEALKTERQPTFGWRLEESNPGAFVGRTRDDGVE